MGILGDVYSKPSVAAKVKSPDAVQVFRRFRDLSIKLHGTRVKFAFEGDGIGRWLNKMNYFDSQAQNLKPVFDSFGDYMLRSIDRTFQAEGRPKPWAPLAPGTIEDRIRKGYGRGPILVRTGDLKRGFGVDTGPAFFRISNGMRYFKFHQYGTKKAPQRIMVQLLRQDKAQFTRAYRRHLGL